jgi:hypothetical protein
MNKLEFRKLIREEVRKVIKEASNPNTLTLSDFISKEMIKVRDDQPLKNIAKFLKTSESDVMVVVEGSAAFKKLYKFYDGPKYVNSFNRAPLKPLDVNPDAEFGAMYYSKPGNVFFFDGGGVNNDYYFITKKQLNTLTSSAQTNLK